jgi:hypothetical protein
MLMIRLVVEKHQFGIFLKNRKIYILKQILKEGHELMNLPRF